jgi:PHD/YefM family antitoxin component YafN of YafNO toxin-antitoxin module
VCGPIEPLVTLDFHQHVSYVVVEHFEVAMAEISSSEVSKNFSMYREMADGTRGSPEPVLVLHYNKPSVVIVAADEYARLKRRDRVVGPTEDLPEWLARQIAETKMDPRFNYLDEAD